MSGLHHRKCCDHQALCPAFGGTPPPWPEVVPGPDTPLPHQRAAVEAAAARAAQDAAASDGSADLMAVVDAVSAPPA